MGHYCPATLPVQTSCTTCTVQVTSYMCLLLLQKKKKAKGFQISYPMTYYDPPSFGVANVSLAAKKNAKGKAKK